MLSPFCRGPHGPCYSAPRPPGTSSGPSWCPWREGRGRNAGGLPARWMSALHTPLREDTFKHQTCVRYFNSFNIHTTTILLEQDKFYTPKRLVNSFVVNVFLKEIKLSHKCFSSVFYYSKDFFIIPVFVTLFIIVQGQLLYGRSKLWRTFT